MNLANKALSKAATLSWPDVQKQLLNVVVQSTPSSTSRNITLTSSSGGITVPSASIAVNKPLVKQCTDLLIKHLKSK
jgi:hypothetical protein